MNSEQVLTTLRAHENELREAGAAHLSLFGSTPDEIPVPAPMSTCWPHWTRQSFFRFSTSSALRFGLPICWGLRSI